MAFNFLTQNLIFNIFSNKKANQYNIFLTRDEKIINVYKLKSLINEYDSIVFKEKLKTEFSSVKYENDFNKYYDYFLNNNQLKKNNNISSDFGKIQNDNFKEFLKEEVFNYLYNKLVIFDSSFFIDFDKVSKNYRDLFILNTYITPDNKIKVGRSGKITFKPDIRSSNIPDEKIEMFKKKFMIDFIRKNQLFIDDTKLIKDLIIIFFENIKQNNKSIFSKLTNELKNKNYQENFIINSFLSEKYIPEIFQFKKNIIDDILNENNYENIKNDYQTELEEFRNGYSNLDLNNINNINEYVKNYNKINKDLLNNLENKIKMDRNYENIKNDLLEINIIENYFYKKAQEIIKEKLITKIKNTIKEDNNIKEIIKEIEKKIKENGLTGNPDEGFCLKPNQLYEYNSYKNSIFENIENIEENNRVEMFKKTEMMFYVFDLMHDSKGFCKNKMYTSENREIAKIENNIKKEKNNVKKYGLYQNYILKKEYEYINQPGNIPKKYLDTFTLSDEENIKLIQSIQRKDINNININNIIPNKNFLQNLLFKKIDTENQIIKIEEIFGKDIFKKLNKNVEENVFKYLMINKNKPTIYQTIYKKIINNNKLQGYRNVRTLWNEFQDKIEDSEKKITSTKDAYGSSEIRTLDSYIDLLNENVETKNYISKNTNSANILDPATQLGYLLKREFKSNQISSGFSENRFLCKNSLLIKYPNDITHAQFVVYLYKNDETYFLIPMYNNINKIYKKDITIENINSDDIMFYVIKDNIYKNTDCNYDNINGRKDFRIDRRYCKFWGDWGQILYSSFYTKSNLVVPDLYTSGDRASLLHGAYTINNLNTIVWINKKYILKTFNQSGFGPFDNKRKIKEKMNQKFAKEKRKKIREEKLRKLRQDKIQQKRQDNIEMLDIQIQQLKYNYIEKKIIQEFLNYYKYLFPKTKNFLIRLTEFDEENDFYLNDIISIKKLLNENKKVKNIFNFLINNDYEIFNRILGINFIFDIFIVYIHNYLEKSNITLRDIYKKKICNLNFLYDIFSSQKSQFDIYMCNNEFLIMSDKKINFNIVKYNQLTEEFKENGFFKKDIENIIQKKRFNVRIKNYNFQNKILKRYRYFLTLNRISDIDCNIDIRNDRFNKTPINFFEQNIYNNELLENINKLHNQIVTIYKKIQNNENKEETLDILNKNPIFDNIKSPLFEIEIINYLKTIINVFYILNEIEETKYESLINFIYFNIELKLKNQSGSGEKIIKNKYIDLKSKKNYTNINPYNIVKKITRKIKNSKKEYKIKNIKTNKVYVFIKKNNEIIFKKTYKDNKTNFVALKKNIHPASLNKTKKINHERDYNPLKNHPASI